MAITLDLEPEVEARLRDQAEACGLGVEEYLLAVIVESIGSPQARRNSEQSG